MKRMKNEASDMGPERLGAANAVIETKNSRMQSGSRRRENYQYGGRDGEPRNGDGASLSAGVEENTLNKQWGSKAMISQQVPISP